MFYGRLQKYTKIKRNRGTLIYFSRDFPLPDLRIKRTSTHLVNAAGESTSGEQVEGEHLGDQREEQNSGYQVQEEQYPGDQQEEQYPGDQQEEQHPGDQRGGQCPGDQQEEQHPGDQQEEQYPGDQQEEHHPGDQQEEQHPGDQGQDLSDGFICEICGKLFLREVNLQLHAKKNKNFIKRDQKQSDNKNEEGA